jgi:protein TonB
LQRVAIALFVVFVLGIILIPRLARDDAADGPPQKPCAPRIYPPESLKAGEQGVTWVKYTTGPDGAVITAEVGRSSGFARLDAAAVEHVKTCKFRRGGFSGTLLEKWVLN